MFSSDLQGVWSISGQTRSSVIGELWCLAAVSVKGLRTGKRSGFRRHSIILFFSVLLPRTCLQFLAYDFTVFYPEILGIHPCFLARSGFSCYDQYVRFWSCRPAGRSIDYWPIDRALHLRNTRPEWLSRKKCWKSGKCALLEFLCFWWCSAEGQSVFETSGLIFKA